MTIKAVRRVFQRSSVRLIVAAVAALLFAGRGAVRPTLQAQGPNPTSIENNQPGDIDWDIAGAGDSTIQGFATDISVNTGGTASFKVKTNAVDYKIHIYRLGYYRGAGARRVATVTPSAALPQPQPACLTNASTGIVDCGNWGVSASWTATGAVSGIYVAKLVRTDNGGASHMVFVVRDDTRQADVLVQSSDTTWQAYNRYGGASTYCAPSGMGASNAGTAYDSGACPNRATKVSYNRPVDTRANDPQSFVFNAEYPMVRWLEANGYDVKYQSGVDTDRFGPLTGTRKPKVFLASGHDEYWSGDQRSNIETARNVGVHLAFFSGNEMFWKTRYEPSIDGSGTAYRTLVVYKETLASAKIDPAVDGTGRPIWTGTWRDPRFSPPADGGRPENGVTGTIWTVNSGAAAMTVPAAMARLRFWQNTRVAALTSGVATLSPESVGYEWDEDLDNGARPSGLVNLSSTTVTGVEKIIDYGATVGQNLTATHSLTLYRHNSGALVFGAGTVQWAWGLDAEHDRGAPAAHVPDQAMQQATVNLLADMGAQPGSLQVGADPTRPLMATSASTDIYAPTSVVTSPAAGTTVDNGNRVTISGTATDNGGGVVAGVDVSVDGGTTWRRAAGTTTWSFDWAPGTLGSATIRSRSVDDSGNLEAAGAGVTVSVIVGACPCPNLWKPAVVPVVTSSSDNSAVELGVKFKSDIAGFITGVRFYKGAANSGTHVGNLWSANGTRLAQAVFTSETTSGWQQVSFGTPVAITANTTYVASYHTNVGGYSADGAYFANTGVDSPPLHALPSATSGGNGVYQYGATGFPTNSYNATNYWVDVVFAASLSDTTPPVISAIKATTIDSARETITWSTDEEATSRIDYGTNPAILTDTTLPPGTLTLSNGSFVVPHSAALVGLQPNTTYYYRLTAADRSGNTTTVAAPTFTVPGPTLRDTAATDFAAGTAAGTYVAQTGDGEVILAPTKGSEFTGPALPAGWVEVPWSPEGYSIIANGVLLVDGARVASCVTDTNGACLPETTTSTPSAVFTAPHSLEFSANFSGDQFQHAGLAVTFSSGSEPWAIFSTLSGGLLFARTNTGNGAIDTGLGTGLLGAFHRYRIDWKTNSVDYYVDGALVVSHAVTVAGPMRPVAASDYNPFGGTVFVDWMRMSAYAGTGSFVSRVFDASSPVDWRSIQWVAKAPAGTGTTAAISVRTGNTPAPDATWSAFVPVTAPGPLALTSQFIQYRADFTTSDPTQTPALEDIIISTDSAPVAVSDSAAVPQNGSHTFPASGPGSLTFNDTDADLTDVLRVTGVTAPAHGTASVTGSGAVIYTPVAGYNGPDAFIYTVSDGLLTASATVTLDVRFGNIAPVANNDFYTGTEDTTLTVPVSSGILVNDTDAELNPLTAVLVGLPAHGLLTLSANGSFSYAPNPNYAGPDTFTYKANDGTDTGNVATVQIQITQVNDPPITEADAFTAVLNEPLDVPAPGVLRNDHDVEVEDTVPLHAQLVTGPTHGQLIFRTDGSFSYTPAADYLGLDTFTYAAVDHFNAVGNVNTVTITAATKAVTAVIAGGATVSTGGGVSAADPLQSAVTSPVNGTVAIAQGVITASQPPTGYTFLNQQVNITITGTDGTELTAQAANPIRMVFTIDRSLIPAGQGYLTFQMFRNGVNIPDCPGATTITAVNRDPCVTNREGGAALNDNVRLTIITSHASRWNMGLSTDVLGDFPVAQNDGVYAVDFQLPRSVSAPGVLGNDYGKNSLTAVLSGTPIGGTVTLASSGAFMFTPATGFCGAASFKYKALDGAIESTEGTASLVIDCTPRAGDDATTVFEDSGASTITVLSNDSDPDPAQTLSIVAVTQGAHGVSAIVGSGMALSYAPQPDFFGSDSFTYTVSDGHNGTATATVSVTVTSVNDAPSFTKGADQTALEDAGPQTIAAWATALSAGPANENGQALSFIVSTTNGALFSAQPALASNGTLTFTSAADANGSATVTVQIRDDGGIANGGTDTSAAQTFAINVTAVNDAPVANNQAVAVTEDTPAPIALTATDIDSTTLTYSIVTAPLHGTLSGTAPNVSYAPALNYNGGDSFTFKANDGLLDSNTATVTLTIAAVNDAPVADNQTVAATEDTLAPITLTASDVDSTTLTYSIVAGPTHGTLSGTAPNVSYTPALNYNGGDSFTFKANDGLLDSNTATVTLAIAAVNDAPVANNGSLTTNEDTPASGALSASDVDGDALTYSIVANGAKGTAAITNAATGAFTYTPNLNANGADAITFQVSDGALTSNVATVSVTIAAVNDAPVASNGSLTTNEDTPASGALSASDVDGDALTYSIVANGTEGTAAITNAATGAFTYTPNLNANGSDAITFQVSDGALTSNTATVSITIAAVNDAPVANSQTVAATEDTLAAITLTATDVDSTTLTYSIVAGPLHGTLSGTAPNVSYTPALNYNGGDSFTFKANDGLLDSNTATVTLAIAAVNDAPVANSQTVAATEDTLAPITLTATDVDSTTLTYSIVAGPLHGTLSGTAPNVSYTPALNYNGSDSFTFKANDGLLNSNTATVTLAIAAVNDAPVASNGSLTTNEDTPASGAMSASDVDGDALTYSIVTNGTKGTAAITNAATGAFTYTPSPNTNGSDSITFQVSDGSLSSNTATVSVTIAAVNDAPIFAKGVNQTVLEDAGAQTVAAWATGISAGGSDESGQALNFIVSNSNNALFAVQPAIAANGTLTFTPTANASGVATVTVQLHDNGGVASGGVDTSAAQTFTISVTAVNDTPSFAKGLDQTVMVDSGAQSTTGWATALSAGPSDESAQTLNFVMTNSNAALFSAQPAVAANGTLTYTSATGATGSATVTAAVHDSGGTANGGVDTSAAQTFTITVKPKPSITIADKSVYEGNSGLTAMPFTVSLSGTSLQTISVNYITGNGTARAGSDYVAASGALTFAPGEVSKTITIQIYGDTTKENNETLGVNLSNAVNATIARATATGTILDDDATPRLSVSSASLVEGTGGTKTMTFAVTPTNGNYLPMSVDYATVAGPAARENIDYMAAVGTLVFPAETVDPQFITVTVVSDKRHEPTQKLFVHLLNAIEAVLDGIDGQGDIVDDDPIPTISVSDVTVGESATGGVNGVVNVTLSNDSNDVITVNYATVAGSALDGVDYVGKSGTLTFQPGITSQAITLTINPDTSYAEGLETFYVDLSTPANATLGKARGVVTITPPTAWVNSTTADFSKGTLGAGAYLSESSNGEVTLAPTVGAEFSGTALPAGWTSTTLATGGSSVVGSGSITVDGAAVVSPTAYTAGHTLEFVATFSGAYQNVGFGLTGATIPPFATFGVKTDGLLYALSVAPGQAFATSIAGNWLGTPHRFRIDWTATTVTYWIDDIQKASHTITYPSNSSSMRAAMSDVTVGGGALKVDWMRMSAYAATGTYTSAVYNAGAQVAWQAATWLADMPAAGGSVVVEVRSGNTATPDTTWSAFKAVSLSGGSIVATAQYVQYRLTLTRSATVVNSAPAVKEVILTFVR